MHTFMNKASENKGSLSRGFTLDGWEILPLAGSLKKGERQVHLEPKIMDVLLCLARHQGEVVSRDMLLSEVWGKVIVTVGADKVPRTIDYFDERGDKIRTMSFEDVQDIEGRKVAVDAVDRPPFEPSEGGGSLGLIAHVASGRFGSGLSHGGSGRGGQSNEVSACDAH